MPKRWKPGSGRQPSMGEAREHVDWVEAKPETRYQPPTGTERGAVTGVTPNKENRGEQLALFPDETAMPEMDLEQHMDAPKSRRERNEANAAEVGGTRVENMRRKAQYDVDSALAEGRSPQFYGDSARNQVGKMAQRTGVDFQTAAASTAVASAQAPWMSGSREVNIERAEGQIETSIREKGIARQEKHKPNVNNPSWEEAAQRDRDYRYENVTKPASEEMYDDRHAKIDSIVEFGSAGFDPADARWGGMSGSGDKPVFGSGLKETSFYQNFRQPKGVEGLAGTETRQNRITLDRHMSDSLVGQDRGDKFRTGQARYRIGADAYGRAAEKSGLSAEGAQAAAWTEVKNRKGHEGGSYDESGEGQSYAERMETSRRNPTMTRRRNNEEMVNPEVL